LAGFPANLKSNPEIGYPMRPDTGYPDGFSVQHLRGVAQTNPDRRNRAKTVRIRKNVSLGMHQILNWPDIQTGHSVQHLIVKYCKLLNKLSKQTLRKLRFLNFKNTVAFAPAPFSFPLPFLSYISLPPCLT
jgi:hypothetical protein